MSYQDLLDSIITNLFHESNEEANATLLRHESEPSSMLVCVDILSDPQLPDEVKIAAGRYLERIVLQFSREWRPSNVAEFRSKVLQGLCECALVHRPSFLAVIDRFIAVDYPMRWPDCISTTTAMLTSGRAQTRWAGLSCALRIFKSDSKRYSKEVEKKLFSIYMECLKAAETAVRCGCFIAGSLLYDFNKLYKIIIATDLPKAFRKLEFFTRSVQVFVDTLLNQVQAYADGSPWAGAKKWAAFCLMDTVYLSTCSQLSQERLELITFRSDYCGHHFTPILDILRPSNNQAPSLPPKAVCYILRSLEMMIPKVVKPAMLDHVEQLLRYTIFPLMCPTRDQILQFDALPVDFLLQELQENMQCSSPDKAATAFLVNLLHCRFGLTICLRAIRHGELAGHNELFGESSPKVACELRTAVRGDELGNSIAVDDLVKKKLCNGQSINSGMARHESGCL